MWPTRTLGETGKWLSGGTPRTANPDYWGGEIPWISSSSLKSFYVSDSWRRLTPLGAVNGTKLVPKGTVLFVVRGMSLKTEFRVGITTREVAFGQDCKALLVHPTMDSTFVAYALQGQEKKVLQLVEESGHGTGRLPTERLVNLSLPLPPLVEQRRIAAVLRDFDNAIAVLEQIAATCYALGDSLYQTQARVAAQKRPLGDWVTLTKGLSYKGEHLGAGDTALVNLANFSANGRFNAKKLKRYNGEVRDRHIVVDGDLVIANTDLTQRREVLGQPAIVTGVENSKTAAITHHVYAARVTGRRDDLRLWTYFALRTAEFQQRAAGFGTGTTVAMLPAEVVTSYVAPRPSDEQLALWFGKVGMLVERALSAEKESHRLRELRGALLEPLTDGRIRVETGEPDEHAK